MLVIFFFFFKQKTAYEMRISDWSSDVCSSDLGRRQVTTADGNNTAIAIADYTKIKSSGGFLGLDRDKLPASSLLNGLPVEVDTLQWNGGLVANEVNLKSKDLRTASMIHTGTDKRFAQQTAATEADRKSTRLNSSH